MTIKNLINAKDYMDGDTCLICNRTLDIKGLKVAKPYIGVADLDWQIYKHIYIYHHVYNQRVVR